jgi:hypothetical protein
MSEAEAAKHADEILGKHNPGRTARTAGTSGLRTRSRQGGNR